MLEKIPKDRTFTSEMKPTVLIVTLLLFFLSFTLRVHAQTEKVYDDAEKLVSINPIGPEGVLEGVGYTFHENGAVAMETPWVAGKIEGTEKEYYPDGTLKSVCPYQDGVRHGMYIGYHPDGSVKLRQPWVEGLRQGKTYMYYPDGSLYLLGYMEGDSLMFAQRFDENGRLISERLGQVTTPLDTAELPPPVVRLEKGGTLRAGVPHAAQVFIPGIPTAYISITSPDALVESTGLEQWPVLLVPAQAGFCTLYLTARTHTKAGASLVRKVVLKVTE
jgi:hypothetical protein